MIRLEEKRGTYECLAYSPDSKTLASGGCQTKGGANANGVVKLWDVSTGAKLMTLGESHGFAVDQIAFSPDGKLLASGCGFRDEGYLMLTDLHSQEQHVLDRYRAIFTLAFDPTGKTLAAAGYGSTVWLWDVVGKEATKMRIRSGAGRDGSTYVRSLAYSPDGRILAMGFMAEQRERSSGKERWVHTHEVQFRDLSLGRTRATLRGHRKYVNAVTISPDGKLAASASEDRTIRLYALATGQELATLEGHTKGVDALAFTPDGTLVSGSQDGTVIVWDVAAAAPRQTFDWQIGPIRSVAASPDGSTAAAAGSGGIVIWDRD